MKAKSRPSVSRAGYYIDHNGLLQNLWDQCVEKDEEIERLKRKAMAVEKLLSDRILLAMVAQNLNSNSGPTSGST